MLRTFRILATAKDDLAWLKAKQLKLMQRTLMLLQEIQKNPFTGIGKPEPLKGDLQGLWSRRINREHRLVYKVTETEIIIFACRYHY